MKRIYLPVAELLCCVSIYISALIYVFYQAYLVGNELSRIDPYAYFTDGWLIPHRHRDYDDTEWEGFLLFTTKYIFWYICHILITEIVRFTLPRKTPLTHALIGAAFVMVNYDLYIVALTAVLVFSFYCLKRTRPLYIWLNVISWLVVLNMLKIQGLRKVFDIDLAEVVVMEAFLFFSWVILRLASVTLDYCNAGRDERAKISLDIFLGYVLYIPTMLHGPPMVFQRYMHMVPLNRYQHVEDFLKRLRTLIGVLLKVLFLFFVFEACMHLIYANAVAMNPQVVSLRNRWAFYGFVISIGHYFCIKYMIIYGFGSAIARFERIDAPDPPKCVARIHIYSHMWRYFDQGLHDFLFKYVYKGLCDRNASTGKKLLASIVAFSFIYLWHGYFNFVLIWAILNFLCLQAENFGKKFSETYMCKRLMRIVGNRNSLRLKAVAGSQLLIISILSNIIFVGGERLGFEAVEQTYLKNDLLGYALISIGAYCFFVTGELAFRWEAHRTPIQNGVTFK